MVNHQRLAFAHKWWHRANQEEDPFDRFFCLWISLIVAARRKVDEESLRPNRDTDGGVVRAYFVANCTNVVSVLQRRSEALRLAAERRRPESDSTDRLSSTRPVRPGLGRLTADLSRRRRPQDQVLADQAAELFNRVRNNLFHGGKLYDDREDLELLEAVNPVVSDVLATCERFIE